MYGAAMSTLDTGVVEPAKDAAAADDKAGGMMGEDFPDKGPLQIGYQKCAHHFAADSCALRSRSARSDASGVDFAMLCIDFRGHSRAPRDLANRVL